MLNISKRELHQLVDELPEGETLDAKRFLKFLIARSGDPVLQAFLNAPEDDESLDEEEMKALEEGERAAAQGETQSLEEVMREFGLWGWRSLNRRKRSHCL